MKLETIFYFFFLFAVGVALARSNSESNIKYTLLSPMEYEGRVGQTKAFFEILLKDKTILDGRKFDYTNDNADMIRAKIAQGFDVIIRSYSNYPWGSRTTAYHDDWTINLNPKKLDRPKCEIVNTLVHESTHAMGYSHGSDNREGKENSFPYWLGQLAQTYCEQGKI